MTAERGQPETVAITGATGLLGRALARELKRRGAAVRRLVRGAVAAGSTDVRWDPAGGVLDPAGLEGVDAIVHLAGEPVFGRWTEARKARILASRVDGTSLLARTVAAMAERPRVLVSASAIGFYGHRPGEILDEASAPGDDFLARVCQAWEAAIGPAADAGVRVVRVRTGIVLTPDGGALANMLTPFKLGVGGALGDGSQVMSWISLPDVVGALLLALGSEAIEGPVNLVAPNPVSGAVFARTLGAVLGRPAFVPVPAFALKLALGEVATVALSSQDVRPTALREAGYRFEHPELEPALRAALER